jgi:ATP-binding cassette subfamily B protein
VGRLVAQLRPYPGLTALAAALMLVVLGTELAVPRILGGAVDSCALLVEPGLAPPGTPGLRHHALVYGVVALLGLAARFGGGMARTVLVQRVLTDLRLRIHETIQALAFRWHDAHAPGQTLARATRDVEKTRRFYLDVLTSGGELVLVTGGSLVLILLLDVLLGLISIAVVTLVFWLVLRFGQRLRPMWRQADDDYDDVTRAVQETVAGARVIRAFGREQAEITRFRARTETFTDSLLNAAHYWAMRMPLTHCLFGCLIPVLLADTLVQRRGGAVHRLAARARAPAQQPGRT